ncbi:MAG: hypothetical protein A2161_16500 [Candidatus Schekmanbacteria bacterium RBG_13_48_7]|uniref:Type II secretion system protein GspF domain-containing protein n=1 Tax=Candidatus Schekmanbacteria bacterium RBG_13_48_7 TaxID=1817878 RepID=A0A1F7RWT0_9BACT|nr:MAG: hypothetical protein A2161_16500 [Candidatus Schekmanbacteria bacterium RBG_13_48_7]
MKEKNVSTVQFFQKMLLSFMKMEYPVVKGLVGAEGIFKGHFFKKVIYDIQQKIASGNTLANSLSEYPEYFSPLFLKMVEVGEHSGTLPSIIEHYLNISETTNQINRKVKNLFIQPVATLIVSILVIFIALMTAYPAFEMLYSNFGQDIPLSSRIIMYVAQTLRENIESCIVVVAVLIITLGLLRRKQGFRKLSDRILYHLPIIGKGYQLAAQIRWTEVLKLLLKSNVGLSEAVRLAGQASGYVNYEHYSTKVAENIQKGEPFGASIDRKILPKSMNDLLIAGEEKGVLIEELENISTFMKIELDASIPEILTKIQLVLTLIIGFIIGTLLFSLYMPLLQISHLTI